MSFYSFLLVLMSVSGMIVFCSMRNHLLLTLLSLEFLILILYFMFLIFLCLYSFCFYFVLIFLTFSVCESVLGLGILVTLIRSHGNDLISSMSILGW